MSIVLRGVSKTFRTEDRVTDAVQPSDRACGEGSFTAILVTHSIPEAILLADRVLVMSARPGRIIADERVPFPRPRSLDILESSSFVRLARRLHGLLQ